MVLLKSFYSSPHRQYLIQGLQGSHYPDRTQWSSSVQLLKCGNYRQGPPHPVSTAVSVLTRSRGWQGQSGRAHLGLNPSFCALPNRHFNHSSYQAGLLRGLLKIRKKNCMIEPGWRDSKLKMMLFCKWTKHFSII